MQFICTACGHTDFAKKKVAGSFLGELVIWILMLILAIYVSWLFLILGLIYSIFRANSGKKVCKLCLSQAIIPVESPNGQKLLREKMPEAERPTDPNVKIEPPAAEYLTTSNTQTLIIIVVAVFAIILMVISSIK